MFKLFAIVVVAIIVIGYLSPYLYNLFPFMTIFQYLSMFVNMIKTYSMNAFNMIVTSGNLWLFIVIGISYFILGYVLSIFFKRGGKE